jgi:hypothetical protein
MSSKTLKNGPFWMDQVVLERLRLPKIKRLRPKLGIEQVRKNLHQRAYGKWLFIIDGCEDMVFDTAMLSTQFKFEPSTEFQSHLEPFPPFHGLRGRCLVTSRNQKLSIPLQSFYKVTVSKPDPETRIKILEVLLRKKHLPIDRDAAITLLGKIDFLPSAITKAAVYMNRNGCGISDYIKVLASRGARRSVDFPSDRSRTMRIFENSEISWSLVIRA